MPQVDFYVLESGEPSAREDFVGRFLQKLQKLGSSAYLAVDSSEQAQALDAALWAFPPESFLPHSLLSAGQGAPAEAFVISAQPEDGIDQQVYINLRRAVPACHRQLQRLVEVVIKGDEQVLADTRRHFAFYREQGYAVESHDIG